MGSDSRFIPVRVELWNCMVLLDSSTGTCLLDLCDKCITACPISISIEAFLSKNRDSLTQKSKQQMLTCVHITSMQANTHTHTKGTLLLFQAMSAA